MNDHRRIDARSLALARAIVEHIDREPQRTGLETARTVLARWRQTQDLSVMAEWQAILERPWEEIRLVLLDEGETGCRLRQSSPFCQVLSNRERWDIHHAFAS